MALIPKDDVKKVIGRSPDRADAFVLALHDAPPPPRATPALLSESYPTV